MRFRLSILASLTASAIGCGTYSGGTAPPPPPPGPPPPPVSTSAIDINDNVFVPPNATVSAGATVTWTWKGATGHNLTFEDGKESAPTQTSGTHSRTFTTAGTFRYRCTIHSTEFGSGMAGQVVVQ